jgi:hypothetical protein
MVVMRVLFICLLFGSSGQDIAYIRYLYRDAPGDERKATALIRLLDEQYEHTPVTLGYRGAAGMVMARHAANPYVKLRYFNRGRDMLEGAIARDRNNPELRYLRYTIQFNVPPFLGYNTHMEEDKRFLQTKLHALSDGQLRNMIWLLLNEQQHEKH